MAVLATNFSGHLQNQLTRSLERILEEANQSGELKLSNRKLKDFPQAGSKYNLSDTVIADLSKNRFSELPDEITAFPFLERLHCYHNGIRYIPDTVSNLQCLSYIDLSRNQLTALPREICLLPVQILLVANNRLTCLPDELCKMQKLTELDASCNQLTHLPPRMGDLRLLQSLVLRNNLLLCVPLELTYLKLVRLDLRANRISSLPVEMRNMTSVIELLVDDNPLTSPPASLCKRGRVHIYKYLEIEAIKLGHKVGLTGGTGTLGRKTRRSGGSSSNSPSLHLSERLKQKRQNVDSGYSTSSDGFDKRWSQEIVIAGDTGDKHWSSTPITIRASEMNGVHSNNSTPSTISPGLDNTFEDDGSRPNTSSESCDSKKEDRTGNSVRIVPCATETANLSNGGTAEDKSRGFQQIQTYKEYKEALKQQRAQDVPSIYRTKEPEDQSYKTEPNTPTHHGSPSRTTLATSKSDPTPLNSSFGSPKHIYDDCPSPKKPVQKVTPSRTVVTPTAPTVNGNNIECNNTNGTTKYIHDYVKPNSPVKCSTGILSHDNVPPSSPALVNGKPGSPRTYGNNYTNTNNCNKNVNGVKANRTISWNQDVPKDKMSFTMRREIDKAKEETELINQLRIIIETRLKMALPEDLAPALTDGVVLCHLANHIKPRSVASIHVPSPAVPKLTMARCRRNVDNFIEACRKIGVDEGRLCSSVDVLENLGGRGLPRLLSTVEALCQSKPDPAGNRKVQGPHDTAVSLVLLAIFVLTVALLIVYPPPD